MITRQVRLQLIVFGIVAVLGLVYTGGRYAGLGKLVPGYDDGYLVNAEFVDSGGVFEGAEVTYRGVPVGSVEKLSLRDGGITVGLRLDPGSRVPTPVKAVVGNRSAVGEQYVDLLPQSDGDDVLAEGDVIPQDMTAIPIQPTQLVVNLDRLVRSLDTADVTTVLDELGQAFTGAGDDLQRLIDSSDQLTAAATTNLPQTLKLIRDSKPVLQTQLDVAGSFQAYNRDLASLTAQLRSSDPDFRKLFKDGAESAATVKSLLDANRTALPVLLGNLVFASQVQAVRLPAIRQILTTYPNVVAGGFTVTPGDGTAHFGFATTMSPSACTQGYEKSVKRDFADTALKAPNYNAYCSAPEPTDVRGAARSPRAEGLKPFPNEGTPTNKASLFAGETDTQGWTTAFADYDPTSGAAITAQGERFTLSSTNGAAALFGEQSWQWLLMDPLTRS